MSKSENVLMQFVKCIILGIFTFILDASILYIITELGVYYLVSAAISYVITLGIHFMLSKKLIFTSTRFSLCFEVAAYISIALVGLFLTELFMYYFTDLLNIYYILSKFLATSLTLLWSFSARKFWLYK